MTEVKRAVELLKSQQPDDVVEGDIARLLHGSDDLISQGAITLAVAALRLNLADRMAKRVLGGPRIQHLTSFLWDVSPTNPPQEYFLKELFAIPGFDGNTILFGMIFGHLKNVCPNLPKDVTALFVETLRPSLLMLCEDLPMYVQRAGFSRN